MKRALTAHEMRAVDAAAARFGMPADVLMENAGQALAAAALRLASARGKFHVVCGLGNNGGDGLVAARVLAAKGRAVSVELAGERTKLHGEPARNWVALEASGLSAGPTPAVEALGEGDVVIDALFGTGLSRAPEGQHAESIERIAFWRGRGARVLAADLPSGLDSDSGAPLGPCVTADATSSFGFLKLGQVTEPGASRCGTLEVVDIGIPPAALEAVTAPPVHLVEEADVRSRLPLRQVTDHKGTHGHVLIIAGSRGKTGAAALAGMAALRAGAGLVTVATRPDALEAVLQHAPELMGLELAEGGPLNTGDLERLVLAAQGKSAVVLGPGIPRGDETGALLEALFQKLAVPCVLDADGLNALAGQVGRLKAALGPVLLTPHPGEMARLLHRSTKEVQADRIAAARELARSASAVVALKGARTVVAQADGAVYVNPTGNPGLGTGGTGDVLAGVCGALLAQGLGAVDAAVAGVYVHGLAGDLMARRTGQLGLVASDLLMGLQEVWVSWRR